MERHSQVLQSPWVPVILLLPSLPTARHPHSMLSGPGAQKLVGGCLMFMVSFTYTPGCSISFSLRFRLWLFSPILRSCRLQPIGWLPCWFVVRPASHKSSCFVRRQLVFLIPFGDKSREESPAENHILGRPSLFARLSGKHSAQAESTRHPLTSLFRLSSPLN